MINEVFIVDGVRTAIGSFGGSLSSKTPIELAALVTKAAINESKVNAKAVELGRQQIPVLTGNPEKIILTYLQKDLS